jgi:uncharacterized protein YgbK (DUF1537 family)
VTGFTAIADDLTGACDVAAELAAAGRQAHVVVAGGAPPDDEGDEGIVIANTQSRSLPAPAAYARVREALAARPAPLVLKKIDTALRGHLGAELDAAVDALAAPVFVLAAIPAAGRVTRNGCQWFGDRPLAETEFARDPEGPGAVSSIPDVVARESRRAVAVLGRAAVHDGFADAVARQRARGVEIFVVDAESESDVVAAVAAVLRLDRPLCLAGSIALAAALAPRLDAAIEARREAPPARLPLPALVVSGSLHSRARAQTDAVLATGRAVAVSVRASAEVAALTEQAGAVQAALAAGTSVVLAPIAAVGVPTADQLRATERALADVVCAVAARGAIPTLVLIGGETSHAILRRLDAGMIHVHGRVAPLIARGTIGCGVAAGTVLITKGGSGGEPDVIARVLAGEGA